jgi:hypothetical protein
VQRIHLHQVLFYLKLDRLPPKNNGPEIVGNEFRIAK